MIVHIQDQLIKCPLEKSEGTGVGAGLGMGPIGVIVAPTRELAKQIYTEIRKFSKSQRLR